MLSPGLSIDGLGLYYLLVIRLSLVFPQPQTASSGNLKQLLFQADAPGYDLPHFQHLRPICVSFERATRLCFCP